jgi:uroporphyrinogen decarboxylase
MTSKERVLTALSHAEPDRVPIDYLSNPGIDRRLKEHFGLSADDGEGLRQALHVDFRSVGAPYVGPRLHAEVPDRIVNPCFGTHVRWIEHQSGGYWDYCDFPLQNATLEEVEAWPMPSPNDYDYSHIEEDCRRHRDYCVCLGCMPDVINASAMIRSMEQVLVDLITDDEAGLLYTDRRLAIQLEVLRRTLESAKGGIDLIWMGEDLGTQNSPMISMEVFRKHIRPRHQPFIDLAKSYGVKVMMHSCGSSSWAFEDFIEMGVDVMDTLQPEAANMAPAYLKSKFGDRLSFHGCISTAGPVAYGSVDDVVDYCRETLDIMMPGGGYCFAPTHLLQDNSPTENVVAMYETALEHRMYK